MSRFQVKGWCPGALRPMLSGDGLVVRIRPVMARLDARQAQGIAAAATRHGNGLIDISARGNLQLRGIRTEAHLALLDDLDALGLIDADPATETHRNILVSPFWTADPVWTEVAKGVRALLQEAGFAALPAKFGISLDLARPMVLQAVSSDIRLEWHQAGILVRPDGFASGAVAASVDAALQMVRVLLTWFLPRGVTGGRGRMAALTGQARPPGFDQPMTPVVFDPQPGPQALGQLVGLEFGQMTAETLSLLARGPIRITPWRMLLLEGAVSPDLAGLITLPNDPRLRVTACTGAPACPQALQPTRSLARQLATQVPPGKHLHVSGCAKGCAHPKPADVTLCGIETGFDLIRDGRADDVPTARYGASTSIFKAL